MRPTRRALQALHAGLRRLRIRAKRALRRIAHDRVHHHVVTRVIDGDTIDVHKRIALLRTYPVRVRVLNIDTPELGEPFADLATDLTRRLTLHRRVLLVRDTNLTDRYNRALRSVYIPHPQGRWRGAHGGRYRNLSEELALAGLGRAIRIGPNHTDYPTIKSAENAARAAGRGMWGGGPS